VTIRRLLLALATTSAVACAGTHIGSPDDYKPMAFNRVFPYPSPEELAQEKTEVTLATHFTTELPRSVVGASMTTIQQRLLAVLTEAGARVDDRSLEDLKAVRRSFAKRAPRKRGDRIEANWVLVSRVTRYEHEALYEAPSGLFKSDEELAAEPGTCTHHGAVQVDIKAFVLPGDDTARATFSLANEGEFEEKNHDESCPVAKERRQQLMDEVLEEALTCLGTSIKNQFAPRGYLEEHRVSEAGDTHIYKTSMGSENGARPGVELSIFRVQYMTTKDGQKARAEHKIGEAEITDEIGKGFSWVSVNPGELEQPLLAGDMVRAVYHDDLVSGLGLGKCEDILTADVQVR